MFKLLLLFCSLSLTSCSFKGIIQTPMLWKITGNGLLKPSYLFGTYHTRDTSLNRLPDIIYSSLATSDRLYTEIRMTKKNTLKVQQYTLLKQSNPLKQRLHPKTYKKLLHHLIKYKVPLSIHILAKYKTWGIALMLNNQSQEGSFMDEYLTIFAKKRHIKQMGLESPIEQLHYFDTLPQSLQEQLLLNTLSTQNNNNYTLALTKWYIAGNPEGFIQLKQTFSTNNTRQNKLDKVLLHGLLEERNERFINRIVTLLKQTHSLSYFFAIGAGHLGEKKGVLSKLKQKGYTLRQLK